MSLVASKVSYRYAVGTSLEHQALDDVSLEVAPGTSTLIIGNTGSGKSTLLRQLAGLLTPETGSVALDGAAPRAGQVGIVFQHPESQLFADTVLEDVAFGPKNLGMDEARASEAAKVALGRIGLSADEFGARSPFSLSGGQARRVAIAGVLALEPGYVLFDEPTAGLDGRGRAFVQSLLSELVAAGAGLVIVSHDVDEFIDRVDTVVLMSQGRIVWKGPAAELIADPNLFEGAGIAMPDLLVFQRELACMRGSYSFDVDQVARWALAGYATPGPRPHVHDGTSGHAHAEEGSDLDAGGGR